jgi:ribonucleoside-diphosphate reductase alpha chain
MSCSKTINIPTEYPFEDTKKVYDYCWKNGIKGCTIFRPNPLRQGILISPEIKKEEDIQPEVKELKRGEWQEVADDTEYYRRKIYIGCGKLSLFIGYSHSLKSIQDLYVVRSGHGGCERNLQGMVIAMSGMLRLGGNIFNIEKAFDGVGVCPSFISQRVKGEKVSSGSSCGIAILTEIKKFLFFATDSCLEKY